MKYSFSDFLTILYSIFLLTFLALLPFCIFGLIIDYNAIKSSGFSGQNLGISIIALYGLICGISMLVPPFRRIYKKLPWLYVYTQILTVDLLIVTIAIYILNYGYEVQDTSRNTIFLILSIISLVVLRLLTCIYYKFKPLKNVKE